jgi:lysophospholipase L1-like esterase
VKIHALSCRIIISAVALGGIVSCSGAGDPTRPVPRTEEFSWMSVATWKAKHAADVAVAQQGGVDLLFVGDSITDGWNDNAIWQKHFAAWHPANFGIGGDLTENVLWRLENGAVGNLQPKAVVLLIGTNNLGWQQEPADVARGITAIVAKLRASFPEARLLVLGVFPRNESPTDPMRAKIAAVNTSVAALDDGKHVFVRDIGHVFLEPDGTISKAVMPDFLHLSEEGYRRWAAAIAPTLESWLK